NYAATQPAAGGDAGPTETAPATQAQDERGRLEEVARDARELYDDAVQEVLNTNLNRRRFEEVIELEEKSTVRKNSLAELKTAHADLLPQIEAVLAAYKNFRENARFLDSSADLKRLMRGAGKLEFRILAPPDPANPARYARYRDALKDNRVRFPEDELGWFKVDNPIQFFNFDSPADLERFDPLQSSYVVGKLEDDYYVLAKTGASDGLLQDVPGQSPWRLRKAEFGRDEHQRHAVDFELDEIGGKYFLDLTTRNLEQPLGIFVDDVVYSAPNIRSAISTRGQITGEFSPDKVRYLVSTMQGGTLPARLKDTPLSERTIGSSLGETNRDLAVRAGVFGIAAVIVIMLGYYWLCGAIATFAMLLNVFLTLAALAMLGARITLDGIAGLILAVGMSVDANVLIYERMREEKARGTSLRMVVKNGFDRAFSTIFDSNVTTLLTCLIIYYVGSEEVKGFGLTLGWGIALNLFTAVFVTRTIFDLLLKYNLIKGVKMMRIIGVPNIDWYGKAKYLVPVSATVVVAGILLLFARGKNELFDIEFLGGVSAELELKQAGLDDVAIQKRLKEQAETLGASAARLDQAVVTPAAAGRLRIEAPEVDGEQLAALVTEPLEEARLLQRGGAAPVPGENAITVLPESGVTPEQMQARIRALGSELRSVISRLKDATANAVLELGAQARSGLIWNVTTTATNRQLVEYALKHAIGDEMRVAPRTTYVLRGQGDRPYPIRERLLEAVVPGLPPDVRGDLTDHLGGAAFHLEQVDPPLSAAGLKARLDNMHFQPDFEDQPKREFGVFGVTPAMDAAGQPLKNEQGQELYRSLVVAVADPEIRAQIDPQGWYTNLVVPEQKLIQTALAQEQTLRKIMQFKPQIAAASVQRAAIALILSWAMIVAYVWIRFGRVTYGLGGVVALIHDVLLALAFVGFSGWFAATSVGQALLIENFRINMPVVAALLTIIGFSINDTIVIFDRIRETRGRLGIVTPEIINQSINQTLSRTLLTSLTVFTVIVIAYLFGGSSIRGFNYCMVIGILTGVYSTVVIASPMLLFGKWAKTPAMQPARA
ncbi:MAG: protein translocase subunit SecD, partial [Planctomycetota bacterium]